MVRKKKTHTDDSRIIPDQLYEDIKESRVALLCGAGTTTEWGTYGAPTFYEIIRARAGIPPNQPPHAFPDVMQRYCDVVDGGHKRRLISEAIARIEGFAAPGERNRWATSFFRMVAMVPSFDRIVTTNWDPFCERKLNILVPMVEDRDLSLWDDRRKQVLKIHGCVSRPYTMVATREDYDKCIRNNPLIWNKLRDLMATKLFVVIGYSMRDDDFLSVFEEIRGHLGPFKGATYSYDPHASDELVASWAKRGVTVIRGSSIRFMYELLDRLQADDVLPSEKLVADFERQANHITEIHLRMDQRESSGAFASAMYQDGLLHSLEEVLASSNLGLRRDFLDQRQREAESAKKQYESKGDLIEIAYWSGRVEVLRRFNTRLAGPLPCFFHPTKLVPVAKLVKEGGKVKR